MKLDAELLTTGMMVSSPLFEILFLEKAMSVITLKGEKEGKDLRVLLHITVSL